MHYLETRPGRNAVGWAAPTGHRQESYDLRKPIENHWNSSRFRDLGTPAKKKRRGGDAWEPISWEAAVAKTRELVFTIGFEAVPGKSYDLKTKSGVPEPYKIFVQIFQQFYVLKNKQRHKFSTLVTGGQDNHTPGRPQC